MQSQTEEVIHKFILPITQQLSPTSIQYLGLLIQQAKKAISEKEFQAHHEQWKILAKKLNSNEKLSYLKQQNFRVLIIQLIKQEAMNIFNSSYLNRAKIDQEYIRYLKQLGPYFFIEVVMIVSKLKIIHKHFYKRMSQRISENQVDIKILRILELCSEKKRSVNNNKAKFLCIVEDENDRLQITKQLGKMLRESWKRQKSKAFQLQQVLTFDTTSINMSVKQMAKQPAQIFGDDEEDFELNEQILSCPKLREYSFRFSEDEDLLI